MARLALLSWGSHGDVLPLVALAHGLMAAGHRVLIAAQPYHAGFVAAQGVAFHSLGTATSPAQYQRLMERLVDEANPRKQLRELLQTLLLPDLEAQYQDALAVVQQVDLVITHWMQLAGMAAAERLGKRRISFTLNPVGISVVNETAAARNLGRMLSDYIWGDEFQRWRVRHGLPQIESLAEYQYSGRLNLLAVSPALLPEREQLAAQHHITGFWSLAPRHDGQPTGALMATLTDFVAAEQDKPLVVFSFGSMGGRAGELAAIVSETVQALGCRAILQGGWAGLGEALAVRSAHMLCVDYVPHDYLFRQASCVVHHGGAGTTAAALGAGVPAVIVWHMLDQPYWGQRLFDLGLGPRPLARRGLTAADLAERIQEVQGNAHYRQQCRQLAQQLAAEQGVGNAVQAIEAQLAAA